jgi:outer membrane receptor protein involved in Fe transport
MKSLKVKKNVIWRLIAIILLSLSTASLLAQAGQKITGTLFETESKVAIPFANVAVFDSTGITLINGSISDMNGDFAISGMSAGYYNLRISAVGFETLFVSVELENETGRNLGEIMLSATEISIEGIIVVGERVKAMTGANKTAYNVSRKMQEASTKGTDVLKLIPGVQVDLRQNIMLEGSSEIMILVNGRERDRNYLNRLTAEQITRIEVINTPSSGYDGAVTGVINVVLNSKSDTGWDGHIHIEVPISDSEIYLFPAYSLNYSNKKMNIFTSYSGELAYLDIEERLHRKILSESGFDEIISTQHVRQKNWSHRFHYGLDYFLNEKNRFNFYGFYNPYSWEHDGNVTLTTNGDETSDLFARKEDNDLNQSAFYSLYYKHIFSENNGHEILADAGFYTLKAENETTFSNAATDYYQMNSTKPRQINASLKLDHKIGLSKKIKLNSGFQTRKQALKDALNVDFKWAEETLAAYTEIQFNNEKIDLLTGLRFEKSAMKLNNQEAKNYRTLLPALNLNYRLANSQNLRFSYRKSLSWPAFHQINPFVYKEDPFSVQTGNPNLLPEYRQNINIEYSRRFDKSFMAGSVFYTKTSDAINTLTQINHEGIFETNTYNLGALHRYGLQFTGAFSIGKSFSFNPYLRLFEVYALPNDKGLEGGLNNSHKQGMESGFSTIFNLRSNITASVLFQYNTPVQKMQRTYYSGALYFISLDKRFGRSFKAGIISGVPFSKTFVYNGYKIENEDFSTHSEGTVQMSTIPVWFKFTYQFSSGKSRARIERATETFEKSPKKGF